VKISRRLLLFHQAAAAGRGNSGGTVEVGDLVVACSTGDKIRM
jgi:hypothetical protein